MFSIGFTEEPSFAWDPADGDLSPHRWGVTVLGDYRERFAAPIDFWRETDYESQWREGVARLIDGQKTSCLVTRMEDPAEDQILQYWTLYRLAETVAVHEQIWVPEFGRLKPTAIYEAINPYDDGTDAEQSPSEWRLPLFAFRDWLRAARG